MNCIFKSGGNARRRGKCGDQKKLHFQVAPQRPTAWKMLHGK
jgi:hypothetical protein